MSTAEQLRTDIGKTRHELAHTVDDLVRRVNPKGQARSVAHTTRDAAQRNWRPLAIAGGVAAGLLVVGRIVQRRRDS
jgi:hypothetical protein